MTRLEAATTEEMSAAFEKLRREIALAEPMILAMAEKLQEAQMVLDDMKLRCGKLSYWLTLRKAQR